MERAVFVYTTYPSIVEAEQAGRALVERRLCACVNIYPGMISYYWWQGAIDRGEEVTMIIKTRASLAEKVRVGGQGDALLYDPGHSRYSARERRPGLSRLDRGRDGGSRRLTRSASPLGGTRHWRARATKQSGPELPDRTALSRSQ